MLVPIEEIQFHNGAGIWISRYYDLKNIIHYHKEMEFIYVVEGVLKAYVNTDGYVAEQGDAVVFNRGDIHYLESVGHCICDILIFDAEIIKQFEQNYLVQNFIPKEKLCAETKTFLDAVAYEVNRQDLFYREAACGAITAFFSVLYRNFGYPRTKIDTVSKAYQNLLSYIDKHYDSVTFSEAAKLMHYSKTYFSKVFKDISGMTFSTYLNLVRVEKAIEKIKTGGKTIMEIANMCGFSTIKHFNRVFKEIVGIPPSKITSDFLFTTNPTRIADNLKTQQYNYSKKN